MKKLVFVYFLVFSLHSLQAQTTPDIFDAARSGTVETVKNILAKDKSLINAVSPQGYKDKSLINAVSPQGYTPLLLATYRGNNEVASYLIDNGANINLTTGFGTIVMAAIVKKNTPILEKLIAAKADINAADEKGVTPLMLAVQFQQAETVALLLKSGAKKDSKDKAGKTAFEYATESGNDNLIKLLK